MVKNVDGCCRFQAALVRARAIVQQRARETIDRSPETPHEAEFAARVRPLVDNVLGSLTRPNSKFVPTVKPDGSAVQMPDEPPVRPDALLALMNELNSWLKYAVGLLFFLFVPSSVPFASSPWLSCCPSVAAGACAPVSASACVRVYVTVICRQELP